MNPRIAAASLALSAAALVGIAQFEGFRSAAYDDGVGVQTIGYGTTEGVKPGDTITPERALVRLLGDASRAEMAVKRCAPVPMHPWEFSAFVSAAYNLGESAFCKSTMAKFLNAGRYAEACAELKKWVYAGGRKLPGLVKRRDAEYSLCIGS